MKKKNTPEDDGALIELIAVNQTLAPATQKSLAEFEDCVALWEDPKAYAQLAIEVEKDYPAKTVIERHITEQITNIIWRQRRIPAIENALLAEAKSKDSKPYMAQKNRETVDSVCKLEGLRKEQLRKIKIGELQDQIQTLGFKIATDLLPPHPSLSSTHPGALYFDEGNPDLSIDADGAMYRKSLKAMEKIAPILLEQWEKIEDADIFFLNNQGFLWPRWHDNFSWPSASEYRLAGCEKRYWFKEDAIDLAIFLIEVAFEKISEWLTVNIGKKEVERVEKGSYFDWSLAKDLANLGVIEVQLHKHLLELINAYFVITKQRGSAL